MTQGAVVEQALTKPVGASVRAGIFSSVRIPSGFKRRLDQP